MSLEDLKKEFGFIKELERYKWKRRRQIEFEKEPYQSIRHQWHF